MDRGSPEVSQRYRNYVLAVLFVVYVFNFIDRQVMSILIDPIKEDVGASDTEMGLLVGLAFALFYTFAGIPIARMADRGSRRTVIVASLSLWSAMTALSGVARSFATLALARVGVGVGEAGGTPPSHALISDYFPPEQRATALALYGNGVYLGAGLGIMAGGLIKEAFDSWRMAFYLVGLAGLPLALLVWATVKEMPRGATEAAPSLDSGLGFWGVVRFLFSRRSFVWLLAASSLTSMAGYGLLNWGGMFLVRVHELSYGDVGRLYGPTIMIGGCLGISYGGWLADRLGGRDLRWYMRMPAIVTVAGLPFGVGFLLAPESFLAIACFIPFYTVSNMYVGPLWSLTQNLVRPDMRATASAILLFVLNLTGLGLGPFLVGLMNDTVFASFGQEAIRYSLLVMVLVGGAACILFWIGSHYLEQDLAARDVQLA